MWMQSAIRALYPPQCLACGDETADEQGLCARCWRETTFITGTACDLCGLPLPGEADAGVVCDECLAIARPWQSGRSVLLYDGTARRMVLGLKHGDRLDMVPALAGWLARRGRELLDGCDLIVPVPVHWTRLLRRRYNQAAVLAVALGKVTGIAAQPDALVRPQRTALLDGKTRDQRFAMLDGAIVAAPDAALKGRTICLVDDVMTSGATLSVAAEACLAAGAAEVRVLTLARVAKSP